MSVGDSIGEQLRKRRVELGLSAEQVSIRAQKSGVRGLQQTAILSWERGEGGRSPSVEQLVAWTRALGLAVELREASAQEAA